MVWRDEIGNFDMSRLTLVGWLVFLFSIAVAIGVGLVLGPMFAPQEGGRPSRYGVFSIAVLGSGLGTFFAAKWGLGLAGLKLVRVKAGVASQSDAESLGELQRQLTRSVRLRRFFLLLMPLGFLAPCGLGLGTADIDIEVVDGLTLPQLFLLLSVTLPFIGLAGWMLMRGDAQTHTRALHDAEKAAAARNSR
jgi:hypothetical protein